MIQRYSKRSSADTSGSGSSSLSSSDSFGTPVSVSTLPSPPLSVVTSYNGSQDGNSGIGGKTAYPGNGGVGAGGVYKKIGSHVIMFLFGFVASNFFFLSHGVTARGGVGVDVTSTASSDSFDINGAAKILAQSKRSMTSVSSSDTTIQHRPLLNKKRKFGAILGIFTADKKNDHMYRLRQRKLLGIWNDPRVCPLHEMEQYTEEERNKCELIYTFVMGSNPEGPTEIIDNSTIPILAQEDRNRPRDLSNPDITHLNIKENMNEGKSQTWFYYASLVMEKYGLDYAIKCDGDSAIHLHEFFAFAYINLITYPDMNPINNLYAGSLRDKAFWPRKETDELQSQYETFFGYNFDGIHLYIAGQFYILSKNLITDVLIKEVPNAHEKQYLEGHEDHDITTILYHSHHPIHLVTMGRQHRCWEHPVKGENRWNRIFARERARTNGELFGDKLLSKESSYEEVIVYRNSSLIPVFEI